MTFMKKYINSYGILLRLKKEGPYKMTTPKAITLKQVETAIRKDEETIKKIKAEINEEKLTAIMETEEEYSQIKNTDEWQELCNAHKKLKEYERLYELWKKKNCDDEEAYDEIKQIVDNTFALKYQKIISENIYKDFYIKRTKLTYDKTSYCISLIETIEKCIDELKEYCLEHPNEIKGYKNNR